MKKQKIQILILLVLCIVCVGGYFIIRNHTFETEEETVSVDVTNFNKDDVTELILSGDHEVHLVKSDDVWTENVYLVSSNIVTDFDKDPEDFIDETETETATEETADSADEMAATDAIEETAAAQTLESADGETESADADGENAGTAGETETAESSGD